MNSSGIDVYKLEYCLHKNETLSPCLPITEQRGGGGGGGSVQ